MRASYKRVHTGVRVVRSFFFVSAVLSKRRRWGRDAVKVGDCPRVFLVLTSKRARARMKQELAIRRAGSGV